MKRILSGALLVGAVIFTGDALAGGYDTPMLYSARHMGMGGAAIGYVRDPSALFHNPAGLAHTNRVSVLGNFTLLVGDIHGSPSAIARSIESETTVAPFPMVGGAVRLTDFLVAGFGLYPVASSGATYHYGDGLEDETTLLFVESTLALAANLPGDVRIGLGYRVTYVRLERFQGNPDSGAPPFIDFTLTGHDFEGLRAGVQWTPLSALELGLSYRHVTVTEVDSEGGIALGQGAQDLSTDFKLPSRLGLGARYDWNDLTAFPLVTALDLEWAFQSQNHGAPLEGVQASSGARLSVPNVFEWQNAITLRLGFEYPFYLNLQRGTSRILARLGYVFDGKTANEQYPTAFGTPPAPTHVFTTGVGYADDAFQVNLAYARRDGSTTVTESDLRAPGRRACAFCGLEGDYAIALNGFYLDVSYDY